MGDFLKEREGDNLGIQILQEMGNTLKEGRALLSLSLSLYIKGKEKLICSGMMASLENWGCRKIGTLGEIGDSRNAQCENSSSGYAPEPAFSLYLRLFL